MDAQALAVTETLSNCSGMMVVRLGENGSCCDSSILETRNRRVEEFRKVITKFGLTKIQGLDSLLVDGRLFRVGASSRFQVPWLHQPRAPVWIDAPPDHLARSLVNNTTRRPRCDLWLGSFLLKCQKQGVDKKELLWNNIACLSIWSCLRYYSYSFPKCAACNHQALPGSDLSKVTPGQQ